MQKSQPRILCTVLWLVIVVLVLSIATRVTYGWNRVFDGEITLDGKSYPAMVGMDIRYSHDPFFGERTQGVIDVQSELEDDRVQRYDDLRIEPNAFSNVLYDPTFCYIRAYGWSDSAVDFVDLSGMMNMDGGNMMLLLYDKDFAFAGTDTFGEERAAEVFSYLTLWYGVSDYYTENPFSHTPLIDRETAVATRTETPPDVLLKMAARDFLSDCWEYLLIGVVALLALIMSHWFPQIYLNHWILDALHEGRSGAKKYLNHSRICFTAMGLAVPLFACLAYFFKFNGVWRFSSGNIFFIAMIAAIIALLVLLHRRAWIQITTQP